MENIQRLLLLLLVLFPLRIEAAIAQQPIPVPTLFPVEDFRSRSVSIEGENKNRRGKAVRCGGSLRCSNCRAEDTEERGKQRLVILEGDRSSLLLSKPAPPTPEETSNEAEPEEGATRFCESQCDRHAYT